MCKYLAVVFFCLFNFSFANECKRISDCSCEYNDGTGVSLKLVIDLGDQPLWANETNGNVYYFNPCKDINWTDKYLPNIKKNECEKGYTLCKYDAHKLELIQLGDLQETQFSTGQGLYLNYNVKSNKRTTYVKLVCTSDKKTYFFFESSSNDVTHLLLFSPYACPIVLEDYSKPSTGTVLVIMFFVGLLSYFAIGITVNAFYLGARGMEMVPHLDFWRDLPNLVREGAQFLRNGCKVTNQAPDPDSYDAI
ncbi:uncharacterized protein LOC128720406 [Anopheles nili]|uniref:uncharacterized protein LOC128720406 n=1 Tax=Anopheles nili TaxID=185578 RepID=UPI00237B6C90|nr:uncharacterized protein LOC128720406 [Anopheles nili]